MCELSTHSLREDNNGMFVNSEQKSVMMHPNNAAEASIKF